LVEREEGCVHAGGMERGLCARWWNLRKESEQGKGTRRKGGKKREEEWEHGKGGKNGRMEKEEGAQPVRPVRVGLCQAGEPDLMDDCVANEAHIRYPVR
jgi:hypothetical protein